MVYIDTTEYYSAMRGEACCCPWKELKGVVKSIVSQKVKKKKHARGACSHMEYIKQQNNNKDIIKCTMETNAETR